MRASADSRHRKREALEAAAREVRAAQGTDRDEILAAQRALRQAERTYDLAVDRAQRDVALARAPTPIAAYGRRLILYDDRLSTPEQTHELTPSVRARVEGAPEAPLPAARRRRSRMARGGHRPPPRRGRAAQAGRRDREGRG